MEMEKIKPALYIDKSDDYFSNVRWDIISLIPDGPNRILEVGCGNGDTLLQLREIGKAKEIFGVELNEICCHTKSELFDGLFLGDIEESDIPFQDKKFDFIIFADVLEHLISPGQILQKFKILLNENGRIIASIPNIKHYSILFNLIFLDKFEYVPAGILDQSHLRFFKNGKYVEVEE